MLFNSIDFAIFLPIVFALFWVFRKASIKVQNGLIVVASYYFYGSWDWRFLSLIVLSTVIDYSVGILLHKETSNRNRKILLGISLIANLGILGFFKYYNFFLESFVDAFSFFGLDIATRGLNIILPVGISFYTFQTLSYTIDVYKRKLEPTKDLVAFMAFVGFFPQLVAGPIERASNLLPQFHSKRVFNYTKAVDGSRQILWGLFKKVVIADNCAEYVNMFFSNPDQYSGMALIFGAVFFSFQIYGDFSGYSDIAIGVSRLFGFELMRNFAYPYFSRDIAEFWRRWHISLSTWFRDYLYIPLGGSRGSMSNKLRNTILVFCISGFWHGANWTFIVWGALNALYFIPLLIRDRNRDNLTIVAEGKLLPSFKDSISVLSTFGLTTFSWIFFRAESIDHAFTYIQSIYSSIFTMPNGAEFIGGFLHPYWIFSLLVVMLVVEWLGREKDCPINLISKISSRPVRWMLYSIITLAVLSFQGEEQEFIYFQF